MSGLSKSNTNVFHAVDGRYIKNRVLDREKIAASSHHQLELCDGRVVATLDKDAPDYDEMFKSKGTVVPADEVLASKMPSNMKVPMKTREEFIRDQVQLPDSDLLKVLHYYSSKKLSQEPTTKLLRQFDESALLALGLMVEKWADEMIDDTLVDQFVEKKSNKSKNAMQTEEMVFKKSQEVIESSDDEEYELEVSFVESD